MLGGPKTSKGWLKHAKSGGAHLASKTRFCLGLRKPSQNGPKTIISFRETRFELHGHMMRKGWLKHEPIFRADPNVGKRLA